MRQDHDRRRLAPAAPSMPDGSQKSSSSKRLAVGRTEVMQSAR